MPEITNDLLNETFELLEEVTKVIDEDRVILQEYLKSASGSQNYNLSSQIGIQEGLKEWIQGVNDRLKNLKNEDGKTINGDLAVTMPDGQRICEKYASETFCKVIIKVGIEKIKALDMYYCKIPIIATFKHPTYTQEPYGSYYIMTNSDTETKRNQLTEIKQRLNADLKIE